MILNAGILRYSIIRLSNGECARQCEAHNEIEGYYY
jgi:hypothetical protein